MMIFKRPKLVYSMEGHHRPVGKTSKFKLAESADKNRLTFITNSQLSVLY